MDPPMGLIAGQGRLPIITAEGLAAAGRRIACVGLRGQYDPALPAMCEFFCPAGIVQLGRWIHLLRGWGAKDAILVGRVRKTRMYAPFRLLRQIPDWRAVRVWYGTQRHDKRTNALLTGVADELHRCGIRMIPLAPYIPDHLADAGVMTRTQPTDDFRNDLMFGLPIVRRLGDLDIGQALTVHRRRLVAVEAIEGTDLMIHRTGQLCPEGGWTLIKTAKPNQDMRFDVPTVGPTTIAKLQESGGRCLAVEARRVILLDKPALLAEADRAGISVVGFDMQDPTFREP